MATPRRRRGYSVESRRRGDSHHQNRSSSHKSRGRGVDAIRLRGISASRPRRRRDPSADNLRCARGVTATRRPLKTPAGRLLHHLVRHDRLRAVGAQAQRRVGRRGAAGLRSVGGRLVDRVADVVARAPGPPAARQSRPLGFAPVFKTTTLARRGGTSRGVAEVELGRPSTSDSPAIPPRNYPRGAAPRRGRDPRPRRRRCEKRSNPVVASPSSPAGLRRRVHPQRDPLRRARVVGAGTSAHGARGRAHRGPGRLHVRRDVRLRPRRHHGPARVVRVARDARLRPQPVPSAERNSSFATPARPSRRPLVPRWKSQQSNAAKMIEDEPSSRRARSPAGTSLLMSS